MIIKKYLKLIFVNFFILIFFLILIDLVLGSWFKNNFSYRLSSERNIYRVYNFSFQNYIGESLYIRDSNGFRVESEETKTKSIDIIFTGGSTTNQKFLNYNETIVSILDDYFPNRKFVNAGIDGLSIIGHINSFDYWFNKIDNLNPEYFIIYLGINDQGLLKEKFKSIDTFQESDFKSNLREYLEANSFFYKKFRYLKSLLYLKYNFKKGANYVNSKGVVYGERANKSFITYQDYEKKFQIDKEFESKYLILLEKLTKKIKERKSKVIYITQISGNGTNKELFTSAKTIMKHCKSFKLECINLAKFANLNYDDFYDNLHLNPKGSKKASNFLSIELDKILN